MQINKRNHAAQLASRGSNALHTLLYFKDRHVEEEVMLAVLSQKPKQKRRKQFDILLNASCLAGDGHEGSGEWICRPHPALRY